MTGADEVTEAAQSGPPGMVRLTAGLGVNWGAEQAAFEQWYLTTQCGKNHRRVMKNESGFYVDMLVRIAWRAWKRAVERAAAGAVAVDA